MQFHDALLLQLSRENLAFHVARADPLEFLVIVLEEAEVLEGNIHVGVAAILAVLFYRVATAGKGVFVDLLFTVVKSQWRYNDESDRGLFHTFAWECQS